jgi:hypothetical protein
MPSLVKAHFHLFLLILAFCGMTVAFVTLFLPKIFAADCTTNVTNYRYDGLLSTPQLVTGNKFPGKTAPCVVNTNRAGFTDVDLQNEYKYETLKNKYYTKPRAANAAAYPQLTGNATNASFSGGNAITSDKVYNVTGNLDLSGDPTGSYVGVVFVDGNVNFRDNASHGYVYGKGSPTAGLVIIAQGDINIDQDVREINAVLISQGNICTNATSFGPPATCQKSTARTTSFQLIINGSVISLNPSNPSDPTQKPLKLYRDLAASTNFGGGNTQPAELIKADPKYLIILRKIMSQTVSITTEDTTFGIRQ